MSDDAALLGLHGDTIVRGAAHDFAVNVVADAPPPWLRPALTAALDALGAYPDEAPATAAVAARHGRDPADVVLLNGAAQAFWLVAALGPVAPVCVHPSFTEPEVALAAAGRPPRRVVLAEPWTLDPSAVPADADLVIVGNPTNPTGVLHPAAALAELCRPGRVTVVDEAFMDFVPGEAESLAGRDDLDGLVVVRSLTKLLAIPGLRAGYLLAPAPLAARLRARRPGWSVNTLALAATIAAAEHGEHAAAAATRAAAGRDDLAAHLRPHLRVHPAAANFVLAEHPRAPAIVAALRATDGIAVRPAHSFPGLTDRHLRVTVRTPAEHALLAAALERILENDHR